MILTQIGRDLIEITEDNIKSTEIQQLCESGKKVHIIKLKTNDPSKYARNIMDMFPKTKRYIIEDENKVVSFWNNFFKEYEFETNNWKKFYIENVSKQDFIRFFKKHNKIFLNLNNLSKEAFELVQNEIYSVLSMIEIIQGPKAFLKQNINILNDWRGNFVIKEKS